MPADISETFQLQTSPGKWLGAPPVQRGHATIGGKSYPTVKMPDGSVWLAQNLEMTWDGLTTLTGYSTSYNSASCAYWQFDQATYADRGLFYNLPACRYIENNKATLCPGWHVPNSSELNSVMSTVKVASVNDQYGFNLSVYGNGRLGGTAQWREWYTEAPSNSGEGYCLMYFKSSGNYTLYMFRRVLDGVESGPTPGSMSYNYNYHMPLRLLMDDPSQFIPETTTSRNVRIVYTRQAST